MPTRGAHLDDNEPGREALSSEELFAHALARDEAGDPAAAAALYAAVLVTEPGQASALHNLAILLAADGRLDEAVELLARACEAAPGLTQARCNLAIALMRLERTGEAAAELREALKRDPSNVQALSLLGDIAAGEGREAEAQTLYEQALSVDPNHFGALTNLGVLMMAQGRVREAGERFVLALTLEPASAQASYNVANALRAIGRFPEAREYFEKALAIAPQYAEAWNNLGNLARDEDDLERALVCHREAANLRPGHAPSLMNLGHVLRDRGDAPAAREAFAEALRLAPDEVAAELSLAMAELPLVYASEAEIEEARIFFTARLEALIARYAADPENPAWVKAIGASQPFYLAYQGQDDLELQRRYGELVCTVMNARYPGLSFPPSAAPGERIRVGIVSGFFSAHSNWKIPIRGWVDRLDRARFEVFGYYTGRKRDAATAEARSLCSRFVEGPLSVEAWRETILKDRPHVLIYPETGMDPTSAKLAAQRLARVQCASWGHPETSGYPTIDAFLSSEAMEPPGAESFYSEKLVRFPGLGVWIEPGRDEPEPLTREQLGYRKNAVVYWCGQSLPKYVPRFDEVFPRIAQAAGDCQFAFIGLPGAGEAEQIFRKRMADAFDRFGLRAEDHCLFLPRLGKGRFLGAMAAADVFLDSLEWSGCNSTLESLAFNLPIVTMRGRFMRGRHTAAILDVMGLSELVSDSVDDYVAAANRLGADRAWRELVSVKITIGKSRVWRDQTAIAALENFLEEAARGG
jgi:predicted O-linked N-acetylglucosamine transferase (SPINDLY family)